MGSKFCFLIAYVDINVWQCLTLVILCVIIIKAKRYFIVVTELITSQHKQERSLLSVLQMLCVTR